MSSSLLRIDNRRVRFEGVEGVLYNLNRGVSVVLKYSPFKFFKVS